MIGTGTEKIPEHEGYSRDAVERGERQNSWLARQARRAFEHEQKKRPKRQPKVYILTEVKSVVLNVIP